MRKMQKHHDHHLGYFDVPESGFYNLRFEFELHIQYHMYRLYRLIVYDIVYRV